MFPLRPFVASVVLFYFFETRQSFFVNLQLNFITTRDALHRYKIHVRIVIHCIWIQICFLVINFSRYRWIKRETFLYLGFDGFESKYLRIVKTFDLHKKIFSAHPLFPVQAMRLASNPHKPVWNACLSPHVFQLYCANRLLIVLSGYFFETVFRRVISHIFTSVVCDYVLECCHNHQQI